MNHPNLVQQIDDAILAHTGMSQALLIAVSNDDLTQPSDEIACDDHCVFGRWLRSSALSDEVRASKPYQVIDRLHREFHETAGDVARLYEAGDAFGAYTLIDSDYTRKTDTLVRAMEKWRYEILHKPEPTPLADLASPAAPVAPIRPAAPQGPNVPPRDRELIDA